MGIVFRAMEENLGREVALKIVAPHLAHDPEFRERFTREARAQASLESSHVVAVYAHGEEDGYLYIASQLIVDGDLGRLIRTAGVPPLVDALDVIEQVASGLSDAHDAGLVHRDIKPGNVLVRIRSSSVRAYLADFGIARRMDAQATRIGSAAAGTPTYMAPELHGGAAASFVTDVYSLGCLLWVALTGTPPYTGASDYQVIAAHVNDPVPQLAGESPMVQATNRILRIAMAKEPDQRYQSAGAMRADLQAALRLPHTPGAAVPQPSGGTAIRPLAHGTVPRRTGSAPTPPPTSRPGTPSPVGPAPPPSSPVPAPPARRDRGTPPRRRSRTPWVVAAVVAGVLALSGGALAAWRAGGDDPTDPNRGSETVAFVDQDPWEVLRASEKEMGVLDTVRVKGQFPDEDQPGRHLTVDMVVTANGDCHGRMGYAGGGEAEVLRIDGRELVKPNAGFLTSFEPGEAQAFIEALDGRWLEFTKGSQFGSVCDLDEFLERDERDGATATNEGVVTEQGQDAVKIHLREGSQEETYFVMVAEPHYTLRIDEGPQAWFRYSEFDEEFGWELPAASQILKDSEVG
jgi:serine/threonine protein kinase